MSQSEFVQENDGDYDEESASLLSPSETTTSSQSTKEKSAVEMTTINNLQEMKGSIEEEIQTQDQYIDELANAASIIEAQREEARRRVRRYIEEAETEEFRHYYLIALLCIILLGLVLYYKFFL